MLSHLIATHLIDIQRWSWLKLVWFLPPLTPSPAKRAHQQIIARTKPSSTHERWMFCACREILEQITGASSLVFKKRVGQSMVRIFSCVISDPLHRHILFIVTPGYLWFPYLQILISLRGHCWPSKSTSTSSSNNIACVLSLLLHFD